METLKFTTILAVLLFATVGCSNIGNAPAGQSADEAKAAFEAKSAEEKIKVLQASPMAPAEKERRINEIKQKAGMPMDSVSSGAPSNTPATNGPPGSSFPGDPRSAH